MSAFYHEGQSSLTDADRMLVLSVWVGAPLYWGVMMTLMKQQGEQMTEICPVCGVSITANGTVLFKVGQPGTRAKLHARVCQFNQQPGCINQNAELIGEVTPDDGFQMPADLILPDIDNA